MHCMWYDFALLRNSCNEYIPSLYACFCMYLLTRSLWTKINYRKLLKIAQCCEIISEAALLHTYFHTHTFSQYDFHITVEWGAIS